MEPLRVKKVEYSIKKTVKIVAKDETVIPAPTDEHWANASDSISIEKNDGKLIKDKINDILCILQSNGERATAAQRLLPIKEINIISAMITREKSPCVAFYGEATLSVLGRDTIVEFIFGVREESSIYFSFPDFNPAYLFGATRIVFYPISQTRNMQIKSDEYDYNMLIKFPFANKWNYYSSLLLTKEILAEASKLKEKAVAVK